MDKKRCCKCYITLDRLKKDGITDYLVKIIKEDGTEEYICPQCIGGW